MVKYNYWCSDKSMKAILKEILGIYNGWKICQKEIQLEISEHVLKSARDFLKSLSFQFNPSFQNFINPSYKIPIISNNYKDLGELVDVHARPDIICFKEDILLTIEIKTRLFNKVQNEIWDKLSNNENLYFNHYFIRYHFDDPYWAINSYRDLIIFKDNIKKQIKDRIGETFNRLKGNSCEMFRICSSLGEKNNLKRISKNCALPINTLNRIKHRIAVVLVPFYISNEQKAVLINCLKRLQLFCINYLNFKIHLQLWNLEPIDTEFILNKGDPNGYKIKIIPIEENTPNFQLIKDQEYFIDINSIKIQKMYNLITDKTLWRNCTSCLYYKKFCLDKFNIC